MATTCIAAPVAVCCGSDCAKDERVAHRKLLDALTGVPVIRTKCLGPCTGPVAIVDPHGTKPVVIEKLRKSGHHDRVRRIAEGKKPGDWKRVVSGKRRRKAIAKAQGR